MPKNIIVTTTINPPTEATIKFCQMENWSFVIVGDLKTPHHLYHELEKKYPQVTYLTPEHQDELYPQLSKIIGWKTIQRRNIGFVYAFRQHAQIIATVDDDNIPYATWGKNIYVNKTISVDTYETKESIFDPLSVTKNNNLWHRGFPLELIKTKNNVFKNGSTKREVLVQADLWDGDPDVDAVERICFSPEVNFDDIKNPYCSNKMSPFNSQNTFLSRKVIPFYSVIPFVGRMDDIWSSYLLQFDFPQKNIYSPATVYQMRNPQNTIKNLQDEIFGYKYTASGLRSKESMLELLPPKSRHFLKIYQKQFK